MSLVEPDPLLSLKARNTLYHEGNPIHAKEEWRAYKNGLISTTLP